MVSLETELNATADARMRIIVTDGVFSMDGDVAPLKEICDLADKHEALVFVDDCHATGFFGETGTACLRFSLFCLSFSFYLSFPFYLSFSFSLSFYLSLSSLSLFYVVALSLSLFSCLCSFSLFSLSFASTSFYRVSPPTNLCLLHPMITCVL